MATQRPIVTGATAKAGDGVAMPLIERAESNGRAALVSNQRAKELLGWNQQYFST